MTPASGPFPRRMRSTALLLVVGATLLLGTLALSLSMFSQIRDLDGKVDLTDDIVDANVRTLSQVQRELLRLDALLQQPDPAAADLRLQTDLVTQRVQEGTLSYQRQTLGTQELLDRSRELAAHWRTDGLPLARQLVRGGPGTRAAEQQLHDLVRDLELDYNDLVSQGENNRKLQAGEANAEAKTMLSRARWLLGGLVATFLVIGLYSVLAGRFYRSYHRQREHANARLRALNEQLEKHAYVVRATDNLVVITDAAGQIEWVNAAFERSTGYALEEVVGQRPGTLLQGPDTDPDTVRTMHEAVAAGEGFQVEVLNYDREGQPYWSGVETTPVHDRDGNLTGFVSLQRDITELRRRADLLVAAKETAEATARAKSNFLASMSHEIRTPLNSVLGFTDLLLLTQLDPQQREYVSTAHSSGQLLRNLVDDILDFSALETMQVRLERRAFALEGVVEETVRMFAPQARRRGLSLSSEVATDVPAFVWGDETRVRQVLVNLVGNAMKFTEQGSVRIEVRPRVAEDGPVVELRVVDTGIGMSPDQVERLFQPFTQGDASTTRRFGGTGLGLAICRLLTDRMEGRIHVDSTLGAGSTFVVVLPLDPASQSDVVRPQTLAGPAVSSLRVLVADDDVVNQTLIAQMLRRFGIEPDLVGDGRAAVAAARDGHYDAILMDVHMPEMDGVEAAAAVKRALGPSAPRIIAVTASALEGDRERLLGDGMDDYVSKPLQLSALGEALARSLGAVEQGCEDQTSAAVDVDGFVAQTGIDDPDFLVSLVEQLLPQAETALEEAEARVAAGELDALALACHTLAGGAASCGATATAAAAASLERACRDGDLTALDPLRQDLDREVRALRRWLDARSAAADPTALPQARR